MLQQIGSSFNNGCQSVMFQMATGAGKTAIAATWARERGAVLFLCHSLAVIGQAPAEFAKWGVQSLAVGTGYCKWIDAIRCLEIDQFVVASTAITAANNLGDLRHFSAIIVDEAHHAPDPIGKPTRISKLIAAAKQADLPVLGMTATPWRMSRRQGFRATWDDLIIGPSWNELRGQHLADIKMMRGDNQMIRGKGGGSGQDYTETATYENNYYTPIFTRGAIDMLPDCKTILYAVGQRHAVNLAKLSVAKGVPTGLLISSKSMLSDAPSEVETAPQEVNRRFRNGELRLIINVNMVTEGYDLPDCECVMVLRPTKSLALWLQMCGRGSRLATNKNSLLLIDLTDNHERLGDPLMARRWSLDARASDNEDLGDPILRICAGQKGGSCNHFMPASQHICPRCNRAQGSICQTCGKWRLWKHLRAAICDRCRHEEHEENNYKRVKWILKRWTRRGDMYYALVLDDMTRASVFHWQRGIYELVHQEYINASERDYNIEVKLKKQGRWQNVVSAKFCE